MLLYGISYQNVLYCGTVQPQINFAMNKEIWKSVKGYEGIYEVSNLGRCRSLDRRVNSSVGGRFSEGKILKTDELRGYHRFTLCRNQKKKKVFAHQLVARHFIPNPQNKPQINHKDFNKSNNAVDNLEWVTDIENKLHAFKNGVHSTAKLKPKDVIEIKDYLKNTSLTQKEIADKYSIDRSVISRINTGQYWSYVE